jgi:hypothetical protein
VIVSVIATIIETISGSPIVIVLLVVGPTATGTIMDETTGIGVIVEVLCQLGVVVVDTPPNIGGAEAIPEVPPEVVVRDGADMMTSHPQASLLLTESIIDGEA